MKIVAISVIPPCSMSRMAILRGKSFCLQATSYDIHNWHHPRCHSVWCCASDSHVGSNSCARMLDMKSSADENTRTLVSLFSKDLEPMFFCFNILNIKTYIEFKNILISSFVVKKFGLTLIFSRCKVSRIFFSLSFS